MSRPDDITLAQDIAAIEKALLKYIADGDDGPVRDPGMSESWAAQQLVKTLVHEIRVQEARVASLEAWKEKAMIALTAAQRHLALGTPAENSYIIRLGDK